MGRSGHRGDSWKEWKEPLKQVKGRAKGEKVGEERKRENEGWGRVGKEKGRGGWVQGGVDKWGSGEAEKNK